MSISSRGIAHTQIFVLMPPVHARRNGPELLGIDMFTPETPPPSRDHGRTQRETPMFNATTRQLKVT